MLLTLGPCLQTIIASDDKSLRDEINRASSVILDQDTFLEEIGMMITFIESSSEPVALSSILSRPNHLEFLRTVAAAHLTFACSNGLSSLARLAMEVLTFKAENMSLVIEKVERRIGHGLSLLHLAVCSQSDALLRWLLNWALSAGHCWDTSRRSHTGPSVDDLCASILSRNAAKEISSTPLPYPDAIPFSFPARVPI